MSAAMNDYKKMLLFINFYTFVTLVIFFKTKKFHKNTERYTKVNKVKVIGVRDGIVCGWDRMGMT